MARMITMRDEDDVRDATYKRPRYVQERLRRYRDEYRNRDDMYASRALSIIDDIEEGIEHRRSSMAYKKLANTGTLDSIMQIDEFEDILTCGVRMQDVVMTLPSLRARWLQNRLGGYDKDLDREQYGNAVGRTHREYQKIQQHATEVGERSVSYTYALSDKEQHQYSESEKGDIRVTWGALEELLAEDGLDPTSYSNALL